MKKAAWIAAAVLAALWLWWGNSALEVSEYSIESGHLPAGFAGFRIAQISDLHNRSFGPDNEKLLRKLEGTEPDIIVITGDFIDSRRTDMAVSLAFAKEAVQIAPCYYVIGNHESRLSVLPGFLQELSDAGVTVLRNEAVMLERNGDAVTLMGVDDPVMVTKRDDGDDQAALTAALREAAGENSGYTILLSHRPEWFSLYQEFGMDLIFSGHAHGGQFRLPFVGGILAPNQGFFPKYEEGAIMEGDSTLVVSRGLGHSIIPLRINNRPELVVAELHREE